VKTYHMSQAESSETKSNTSGAVNRGH